MHNSSGKEGHLRCLKKKLNMMLILYLQTYKINFSQFNKNRAQSKMFGMAPRSNTQKLKSLYLIIFTQMML